MNLDGPSWLGRTVGVYHVRRAAQDVLQAWMPVALVDVARQWAIDGLEPEKVPQPATWQRLADYRDIRNDQLPHIIVASPGSRSQSVRAPRRDSPTGRGGQIDLTWTLQVAFIVRGWSYEHTADLAGIYGTAISSVLVQHLRTHDLVGAVYPDDGAEQYDLVEQEQSRTVAMGLVSVGVETPDARSQLPQASDPPSDPFDPPPTIPIVEQASSDQNPTVKAPS